MSTLGLPRTLATRSKPTGLGLMRRAPDALLLSLAIVLLGYAVCGKGFAYLGTPPLYLGEWLLLGSLAMFLVVPGAFARLATPPAILLLCLCAWCGLQTARSFGEYGIDTLRDAAIWNYSAIGLAILVACGDRPARLHSLILRYRRFCTIFTLAAPIVFCIFRFARPAIPVVPGGANVPLLSIKEADILVHLAGILAFWTAGLGSRARAWGIFVLTGCAAVMGVIDRAGMVAFGAVFTLCLIARPRRAPAVGGLAAIVAAVTLLWVTDLRVEVPGGKGREISFEQIATNLRSVLGEANNDGLDSTKEWRIEWWKDIVGYTVDGPYFWTGKGFGVNLADDDGYQVQQDRSLRSPHSGHMTFLARAGVPGVTLWLATQATWAAFIVRAYFASRSRNQRTWESLFFFLFCYWLALMINTSFDVYLEGPVGGIWFWSVFGVGLAALDLHRRVPELFDHSPLEAS